MTASLRSIRRGFSVPNGVAAAADARSIATVERRLDAFIDPTNLADSIAERLEAAASGSASEWWWTGWWDVIYSHYDAEPLVVVLAAFVDLMRAGQDPGWVVGSDSAKAAVEVAEGWLSHGIAPSDVHGWLDARCRYPRVARAFTDAGMRPSQLVNGNGQPRSVLDAPSGRPVPLAAAVADGDLNVDQAVAWVQQTAETYRVLVERRRGVWRVDIEGVAVIHVSRLADIASRAHDVIGRLRKDKAANGIWLSLRVRLPVPVQRRLELAEQYRAEAEQSESDAYRQSVVRAAEAALCGAARELVGMGVDVEDIAQLLDVSQQRVHELVAGDSTTSRGDEPWERR